MDAAFEAAQLLHRAPVVLVPPAPENGVPRLLRQQRDGLPLEHGHGPDGFEPRRDRCGVDHEDRQLGALAVRHQHEKVEDADHDREHPAFSGGRVNAPATSTTR